MSRHDDRPDSGYGSYRSNRDVRESRGYRDDPPRRERRIERDPACRVFVEGLNPRTSWQDLKDHMRTGGLAVEYVKIMTDYDGRSKGCGLCEYSNVHDAETALDTLDRSTLADAELTVRPDRGAGGGRSDRGGSDRGGSERRPDRRDDRDRDYRSRSAADPPAACEIGKLCFEPGQSSGLRNSRDDDRGYSRRDRDSDRDDRSYRRERTPER
eukprot:jgi/Astpho2/9848/fgenesh1_pg.00149_%23_91_t